MAGDKNGLDTAKPCRCRPYRRPHAKADEKILMSNDLFQSEDQRGKEAYVAQDIHALLAAL
jgi:hypothetical protein